MPKLSWTVGIKPFIGATTYYTDYVLSLSYMNGRKSYLDEFTGNSLRVTLDNQTNIAQYFTFGAQLTLNDDLSFIVTGVEFDDYPGNTGMSTCTVTASDYLQASGRTVGYFTVALTAAKALAQIDTLYSTFGNTDIVRNGGSSDADAYNYNGTLLQRFQQSLTLEASGAVQLYDAKVAVSGREQNNGTYFRTTFTRATSTGTNVSYRDIVRDRADLKFANQITVQSPTDADVTAFDSASQSLYGIYADSLSIVDTTVDGATGLAQWTANTRSDPAQQTFAIDVVDTSQTQDALARILNIWSDDTAQAKVHDLVYRVPGAGSDTTETVFLEGTQINVTPTQTRLTYYFSPFTLYQFFLLNSSTQGILDTSRLGW
jgi:hypothetical protein